MDIDNDPELAAAVLMSLTAVDEEDKDKNKNKIEEAETETETGAGIEAAGTSHDHADTDTDYQMALALAAEDPHPPTISAGTDKGGGGGGGGGEDHDEALKLAIEMSRASAQRKKPAAPLPKEDFSFSSEAASTFTFANVGNSCYIDTVLMAMFLFDSSLSKYLDIDTGADTGALIMQEQIKIIRNMVRRREPVTPDQMIPLRLLLIDNGWISHSEDLEQQDVKEFYRFIMDKLRIAKSKFKRVTFTEAFVTKDDFGKEEELDCIPLNISPPNPDGTLAKDDTRSMFNRWMNDNPVKVTRTIVEDGVPKETVVDGLNTYYLDNFPPVIALWANRFPDNKTRYDTNLLIKSYLTPFSNQKVDEKQRNMRWQISAVICHRPTFKFKDPPADFSPLKSGHYYALLVDPTMNAYIFDDQQVPSLREVSMKDKTVTNDLKRHGVFVLYTRVGF